LIDAVLERTLDFLVPGNDCSNHR